MLAAAGLSNKQIGQLRDAMIRDGASADQATAQVWLVDKQGLLTSDMTDLRDFQQPYARDPAEVKGWAADGGAISLLDAVRHAGPTILLGTSTAHGAFTQEVIEAMSGAADRPIIFPISTRPRASRPCRLTSSPGPRGRHSWPPASPSTPSNTVA